MKLTTHTGRLRLGIIIALGSLATWLWFDTRLQQHSDSASQYDGIRISRYDDDIEVFPGLQCSAPPEDTQAIERIIQAAYGKYPPCFWQHIGNLKVVLCDSLTLNGTPVPAVPDVYNTRIFVSTNVQSWQWRRFENNLHHELFHILDYRLLNDARIAEWKAINPDGFQYGENSLAMQSDMNAGSRYLATRGFMNRYSQSALVEDRAEVYTAIIQDSDKLEALVLQDDVLNHKMLLIKRDVESICPGLFDFAESATSRGAANAILIGFRFVLAGVVLFAGIMSIAHILAKYRARRQGLQKT